MAFLLSKTNIVNADYGTEKEKKEFKEIGLPSLENISCWIGKQLEKKYSNVRSIKLSRPSCGEYCLYKIK